MFWVENCLKIFLDASTEFLGSIWFNKWVFLQATVWLVVIGQDDPFNLMLIQIEST